MNLEKYHETLPNSSKPPPTHNSLKPHHHHTGLSNFTTNANRNSNKKSHPSSRPKVSKPPASKHPTLSSYPEKSLLSRTIVTPKKSKKKVEAAWFKSIVKRGVCIGMVGLMMVLAATTSVVFLSVSEGCVEVGVSRPSNNTLSPRSNNYLKFFSVASTAGGFLGLPVCF